MTRVIIIDDDHDSVEVFKEYLELKGVEVVGIGHSGDEGLSLYKKYSPDVTFLDTIMGKFDGFYALEEIRDYDSNAKVVLLSGDSSYNFREKLQNSGASGIICKPFDIDNVLDIIENVKKGKVILPKFRTF